jgi:transcriptional regulator with XRE-family HTH domain
MFGDVVRQRRLERGWTQQQLAELVGVTTPYISMIEGKKRGQEPGHDVLVAMAAAFHTTVEELREAATGSAQFPTEEMIAAGLKPEMAQALAAQWERVPIHKRHAILTKAKRLARLYAEIAHIEGGIRRQEGQSGGASPVH